MTATGHHAAADDRARPGRRLARPLRPAAPRHRPLAAVELARLHEAALELWPRAA